MKSGAESGPRHYCTLFDSAFLPQGIVACHSLLRQDSEAIIHILCMDRECHEALQKINIPNTALTRLEEFETKELLDIKGTRSRGEYCWTITPHWLSWIMDHHSVPVTYFDADLFFVSSVAPIFDELEKSGRHALLTEHDFEDRYDTSALYGRFCVQFMPFQNTVIARDILHQWGKQCIEWCYAKPQDGKFGDQKYLDSWPQQYPVRILQSKGLCQAPWNSNKHIDNAACFFHMHGLRFVSRNALRLWYNYEQSDTVLRRYYAPYLKEIRIAVRKLVQLGFLEQPKVLEQWPLQGIRGKLRLLKYYFSKTSPLRTV